MFYSQYHITVLICNSAAILSLDKHHRIAFGADLPMQGRSINIDGDPGAVAHGHILRAARPSVESFLRVARVLSWP